MRFARQIPGETPTDLQVFGTSDYADPAVAAEAYLKTIGETEKPHATAFAVASAFTGDWCELTNHPWSFSIAEIQRRIGSATLRVINDFTAVALAAPHLTPGDLQSIGGGTAVPGEAIAVVGPGTGLGTSALVPAGGGKMVPLENEGGHVTCPAADDRESAVLAILRRRLGHVSAERCLSGVGLVNLYTALAELEGKTPEAVAPEDVTHKAMTGTCPICGTAVEMFCAMMGTVASDLALTVGSRGGVYIAGGIVPKLGKLFIESAFRRRFEDKGRFSDTLRAMPTQIIVHPTPALIGLAALLDDLG